MVGSLTLPCSKLVMQPCGFAGHWEVFSSGRGLVPTGKGRIFGGLLPCQGPQLCCQGSLGTFTCPEKGSRGAQCLTLLQQPPCPPHPLPLLAISPRNGGSCPSSCLLEQSVGNTWALSTGQLREGLPAIPISGAAPDLGLRGASLIPAVLGPGLGALSLPHTDHCKGMLKVLGPLSSLVAVSGVWGTASSVAMESMGIPLKRCLWSVVFPRGGCQTPPHAMGRQCSQGAGLAWHRGWAECGRSLGTGSILAALCH